MRLFVLCLIFAAFPFQAAAQLGGSDNIFVNAAKATYKGNLTILENKVDVRQGDAQVLSDVMHIYRAKTQRSEDAGLEMGAVTRIEAEGNFAYITPDTKVTGKRGVYERETGMITVTGNVKVRQASGNEVDTEKLFYNTETGAIRFTGDCSGKNCNTRPTIRLNEK